MATSETSAQPSEKGTDSATVRLCEEPGGGRGAMLYLSSDDLAALGVDTSGETVEYAVVGGELRVE